MSFTEQPVDAEALASEVSQDPFGRFLKLREVMASIGVSQAMVYKLMHDEMMPFPKPVKVGRSSLWIEREVIAWKTRIVEASELAS